MITLTTGQIISSIIMILVAGFALGASALAIIASKMNNIKENE